MEIIPPESTQIFLLISHKSWNTCEDKWDLNPQILSGLCHRLQSYETAYILSIFYCSFLADVAER